MKKLLLACLAMGGALSSMAQVDSATHEKTDTIQVGGMIIIKRPGKDSGDKEVTFSDHHPHHYSNSSTNWGIVDIGFANLVDNTSYAAAQAQGFVSSGIGKDQLNLRTGKSVNVNIWFFMQKLNMVKHVVNLKYGLGLELNNYRFENQEVRISRNPTFISLDPALANATKNKLAADYITIPLMLNFDFTPGTKHGFGFSAGVSAGYLYSARQKTVVGHVKSKDHGDFDLEKWKMSYVGELSLGPVHLYGSYAFKSMWSRGLDQTPFAVGLRLSNW
jgi:Outer membrane protein beta-barrel domain